MTRSSHFAASSFTFLLLIQGLPALAQGEESEQFRAALIVTDTTAPQEDENVEVVIESATLSYADPVEDSFAQLLQQSAEMRTPEYIAALETAVIIPRSTSEEGLLYNLISLTSEELTIFLSRKQIFLEKFAKVAAFLLVKPKRLNGWLQTLNKEFFKGENPLSVAHGNTVVLNSAIGTSLGVATSDWLRTKTRKISGLSWLPQRSGFYLMFSFGISLYSMQKDGKTKYGISPVLELRRATRMFSPFGFVAAGFNFALTIEQFPLRSFVQKSRFYKISFISFFSSPDQFGVSMPGLGVTLPPGGGIASGLEGDAYRLQLSGGGFAQAYDWARNFLKRRSRCDQGLAPEDRQKSGE